MLYRPTVNNILSQFNITDIKFNRMLHQATFLLENEQAVPFKYIIEKSNHLLNSATRSKFLPKRMIT